MRKLTVLTLALLYVLTLAAVSAFGANAARFGGDNQTLMVPIESRQQPYLETETESATIVKPSSESSSALGFYMSPGLLLETTDYDLQSNARQQRQIGVGSDGRVHFDWTWKAVGGAGGTRACHYRSWTSGGGFTDVVDVSDMVVRTPGRFVALDVFGVKAVPIWHYTKTSVIIATTGAIDAGSGSGAFAVEDPPADVVNCQNIVCRGVAPAAWPGYIWPVVAVGKDASNNCIVHIVASEANTSAGWSALTYFRGQGNSTGFAPGMYGTCGMYVDSNSATAYDVAADPTGPGVVIAYPKARQGNRINNDFAYRYSGDYGQNWGPIVNITNYATGAKERAGEDASVLFDGRHCFHILWLGMPYDSVKSEVSDQECKLYHWTSCNPTCLSLVLDANNHDNNLATKAFEQNVTKIGLTQCARTGTNDTLLYAVYTRYAGTTLAPDRSFKNYPNGEVYVSASSTWGETWGAPVNITNTPTNGCVAPNCADDRFTSSARYVTNELRIQYMEDLDAGSFVSNESSTADLMNPVRFLSHPCFSMTDYQVLSCTPSRIKYPFHAVRNSSAQQPLVLANGGNQSVVWTSSVTYVNGSNWIGALGGGTVTAGCTNTANLTMTATSGNTEGLFQATMKFTYNGGANFVDVPVDFYVFDSWFLPQDIDIRTATNRMNVNQTSEVANDIDKMSFSYFADLTEDYITDGSLIMGTANNNLSWRIFSNGQGDPTVANPFGWLYALSNTTYDSSSFGSYRIAGGKGCNRDTTIEFDVTFYAPKHIDSSDFYIAHFDMYKGRKNPSGTVSGLTIAYSIDFDVPDDSSGSDNTAGSDATRHAMWVKGSYTATHEKGYGSLAAWREDNVAITGGWTWTNSTHVYPLRGYQVDSVWNWITTTNTYRPLPVDTNTDQSTVLIIGKNLTIGPTDRLKFDVIIAGKRGPDNPGGLAGLETTLDQAKDFICRYIAPASPLCAGCTTCGDANGDDAIDISDAVYLIQYIFAGGPEPGPCGYPNGKGDANGDCAVDISDAVYLIQYIFAGGPAPLCGTGCK